MLVTEVKIKLVPPSAENKLLAFASLTLDNCFVVRDIKIIQGTRALFVAMPSRKITDHCRKCGTKNHLQALFCNGCGLQLPERRYRPDERGRARLHADIAHPINAKCRQDVQDAILKAYNDEAERSRKPGYVPQNFDDFDAGPDDEHYIPTPSSGAHVAVGANDKPPLPAGADRTQREDTRGFGILG